MSHTIPKSVPEAETADRIAVLAVSPRDEDHRALRAAFAHTAWTLFTAGTIGDALDLLRRHKPPVILCELELPDGKWTDLQDALASSGRAPSLVVTSRNTDESLWAEVLNRGGYDVLARPFNLGELVRVVSLAWHHWHDGAPAGCAVGS